MVPEVVFLGLQVVAMLMFTPKRNSICSEKLLDARDAENSMQGFSFSNHLDLLEWEIYGTITGFCWDLNIRIFIGIMEFNGNSWQILG